MAIYPDGAIQTSEELLAFTVGTNGVLYRVMNGNAWGSREQSMLEEVKFSRGAYIGASTLSGYDFFYGQKGCAWKNAFSLHDSNVNGFNTYNDHFVFSSKEKAEAYLAAAKQGWHKHSLRNPHNLNPISLHRGER